MRIETTSRNIYKFLELSEQAKQRAVERHSQFESDSFDSNWIIDDIKSTAAMFGLDIANFYYSGFCCQGDGASFTGYYSYKKGGLSDIAADRPNDSALHSIVSAMQEIQRKSFYKLSCAIVQRGHYYHENTMYIDTLYVAGDYPNFDVTSIENDLQECFRNFAKWAYRLIESAYEYQISDESCIESILANEYEFTENGNMV